MNNNYDDIIHLLHHVSKARLPMPMSDRAAQFSPFAALTGYDAAIEETARLAEDRIILDENEIEILNTALQAIEEQLDDEPEATITYFQPDKRKSGGAYVTTTGVVKKIDSYEQVIVLTSGLRIPIAEIFQIRIEE